MTAQKRDQPYSNTMAWVRCCLNFALLWSSIQCIQDACSSIVQAGKELLCLEDLVTSKSNLFLYFLLYSIVLCFYTLYWWTILCKTVALTYSKHTYTDSEVSLITWRTTESWKIAITCRCTIHVWSRKSYNFFTIACYNVQVILCSVCRRSGAGYGLSWNTVLLKTKTYSVSTLLCPNILSRNLSVC